MKVAVSHALTLNWISVTKLRLWLTRVKFMIKFLKLNFYINLIIHTYYLNNVNVSLYQCKLPTSITPIIFVIDILGKPNVW